MIRFLPIIALRLRLKTVLSLIPEKLIPEMQEFCEENNIHLLHLTVDKMKEDNIPLTYNKTLMALHVNTRISHLIISIVMYVCMRFF